MNKVQMLREMEQAGADQTRRFFNPQPRRRARPRSRSRSLFKPSLGATQLPGVYDAFFTDGGGDYDPDKDDPLNTGKSSSSNCMTDAQIREFWGVTSTQLAQIKREPGYSCDPTNVQKAVLSWQAKQRQSSQKSVPVPKQQNITMTPKTTTPSSYEDDRTGPEERGPGGAVQTSGGSGGAIAAALLLVVGGYLVTRK